MDTDLSPRVTPYFWAGWFEGHSLALLCATYILLSTADLVATLRLMLAGVISEGNALADYIWTHSGPAGFIIYKIVLVSFILVVVKLLQQHNDKFARMVLYSGILVMSAVALRHLAIIGSLMMSR